MSRVTERAEIGVMRSHDERAPAGGEQAPELLHGADDIGDVLNDVNCPHFVEGAVPEREGEMVEVSDDIGGGVGIAIESDGAGVFIDPAADVKDRQRRRGHGRRTCGR
jgi:hypothetical protein